MHGSGAAITISCFFNSTFGQPAVAKLRWFLVFYCIAYRLIKAQVALNAYLHNTIFPYVVGIMANAIVYTRHDLDSLQVGVAKRKL